MRQGAKSEGAGSKSTSVSTFERSNRQRRKVDLASRTSCAIIELWVKPQPEAYVALMPRQPG